MDLGETKPVGDTKVEVFNVGNTRDKSGKWLELLRAVAMPLVTLIVGFAFNASLNSRQLAEDKQRLRVEMMGRREEADSALRKDMLKSILDTFMANNQGLPPGEKISQEVLNLELLAYNFHESLDLGPLFKHVRRRIPEKQTPDETAMLSRIEKVARDVNERQLTGFSDSGTVEKGDASLKEIKDGKAFVTFGPHTVKNPNLNLGEGVPLLCMSADSGDEGRRYRQFKLELTDFDPATSEIQVRLYVSRPLDLEDCKRWDLDQHGNAEIDSWFWVGLFDFPMIDNTRLTNDERAAVSLLELAPDSVKIVLAYFPGSRASLKDKPYYDELMNQLDRPAGQRLPVPATTNQRGR